MESSITNFIVSDDMQYIAAVDSSNNIRIWEAVTHKTVADICYPGEAIKGFGFAGEDIFVVLSSNKITGYDTYDWEESWTTEAQSSYIYVDNGISASPESNFFAAVTNDGALVVNAKDGKVVKTFKCEDLGCYSFSDVKMYKDGTLVAFTCPDSDSIDLSSFVYIYDMEKGSFTKLDSNFYLVTASRFTPEGDYAVMFVDNQNVYSSRLGNTVFMAESKVYIQKFDHETGKLLWAAEDEYMSPSIAKRLVIWNYKRSDGSLIEVMVALYSDRCTVINNSTGEVLMSVELPAEYVSCYSSGDNVLLMLLYNGQYCRVELGEDCNTITASAYFGDKIYQSDLINPTQGLIGFLTRRNGDNYLIEYNTACYDESFSEFVTLPGAADVMDWCVAGDYFITFDSNSMLSVIDVETGDLEWSKKIEGADYENVEIIGVSADGGTVFLLDDTIPVDNSKDEGAKLLAANVQYGVIDVVYTYNGKHTLKYMMNGNYICVVDFNLYDDDGSIYLYDIEEDDMTLYQTDNEMGSSLNSALYLSPDGKYLLISFESNSYTTVLFCDLDEDEFEYIEEDSSGILCYAWTEDSSAYACGMTGLISVRDLKGDEVLTIDTSGRNPVAMQYYNDELLVVYSVGVLARYDNEGNLLSEAELDCYAIEADDETSFTFGDDEFVLTVDSYSNVFSLETFMPRSFIFNLDAYVPDKNIFICHGYIDGEKVFGSFENKSIEELIALGYEYITVDQDG